VWSTCIVFYQTALLAGYVYASALARQRARVQALTHCALLVAALCLLPIGPGERWRTTLPDHPAGFIFLMLTVSVGLPFLLLSATSPVLQSWLARGGASEPYRMFSVSNIASLSALLVYPLLVEPLLGTRAQSVAWSLLQVLFTALCAFVAWRMAGASQSPQNAHVTIAHASGKWRWFALSACGSMLLLSVTNHIDENLAAVPLLWILPLAAYLLSFIVTFGAGNFYRRALFLRLLAFALGVLAYAIYNINSRIPLQLGLPVFLCGLFICCVFCHGELNRLRPPTEHLTIFYVMVAAGGAAGAILIGLVAPWLFSGIYELPLTLGCTAVLALALTWEENLWAVRLLWIVVTGCMGVVAWMNIQAYHQDALSLRRSFYGSLRVVETPHAGPKQQRTLYHGTIEHGSQFLQSPRRSRPTTYYGSDSGIGILLRDCLPERKRVGVVGLGVGTLAAYGKTGDEFRFYEINAQVIEMARGLFFYLKETPAKTTILLGDGRQLLQADPQRPFDALVLDAFSGDAIPVHLLTREALVLYRQKIKTSGVIAFHVSNNYLDLAPVIEQLASEAGMHAVLLHNQEDTEEATLPADWVLVTKNIEVLDNPAVLAHARPIQKRTARIWTDDYNDLLTVIKAPVIR